MEARRFGLDPIVLTAVASAESDFRLYAKGPGLRRGPKFSRRLYEYGVWQLFVGGAYTIYAAKQLARCAGRGILCVARDMYVYRKGRHKWFTRRELSTDIRSGSYVAAFEMSEGIKGCKTRHKRAHWRWWMVKAGRKYGMAKATMLRLSRYGHYNTGATPPTNLYLKRLFQRYAKFRDALCPFATVVAK